MIDYLELEDYLGLMRAVIGKGSENVRDWGLLESALGRPRATVFGQDAYPTLPEKASALLSSLARNHTLMDGNKRMAWSSLRAFLYLNGHDLAAHEDDAYDLVILVSTGEVADVAQITARIEPWIQPIGDQ